jgi:hypothetical protein
MSKPGLTLAEHEETGAELAVMSAALTARYVKVANAYPKTARFTRSLDVALDALNRARSQLDDQLARDFPEEFSTRTYYPVAS